MYSGIFRVYALPNDACEVQEVEEAPKAENKNPHADWRTPAIPFHGGEAETDIVAMGMRITHLC